MQIDSIHIEFNAPQAYDMIRLRFWIHDMPLSTSLFARDWIEVIDFLMIADVKNWIAIHVEGLTDES